MSQSATTWAIVCEYLDVVVVKARARVVPACGHLHSRAIGAQVDGNLQSPRTAGTNSRAQQHVHNKPKQVHTVYDTCTPVRKRTGERCKQAGLPKRFRA